MNDSFAPRAQGPAERIYHCGGLEVVHWGVTAWKSVAAIAARRAAVRVLIVASPSFLRGSRLVQATRDALGERCVGVFDSLTPHTPAPQVDALAEVLSEHCVDLVVTFGGGTPIDTVKVALAMQAAGVGKALDLVATAPGEAKPRTRQVAVPTTLSGAEFSDLAGLSDPATRVKHSLGAPGIGPVEVVLDPQATLATPLPLWLSTGLRAIDHAVETICSIAPTPFTDALAVAGLRALADALRGTALRPQDEASRLSAQQAVWMASAGLGRTPFGASHGIGHQLGAVSGVPHGLCSCVLLAAVLDWNAEANAEQQALVARALGATRASEGVRALVRDLGLPGRLRDVRVAREDLPHIAASALSNRWVASNPRPIREASDALAILQSAW